MTMDIVAWRSRLLDNNNHVIWQQYPNGYSGELEPLVKYEDHQRIVADLQKQIDDLNKDIVRRITQQWAKEKY